MLTQRAYVFATLMLFLPIFAYAFAIPGQLKTPTDKCANQTIKLVSGHIVQEMSGQSGPAYEACLTHKAVCSPGVCVCGTTNFYAIDGTLVRQGINNCSADYNKQLQQFSPSGVAGNALSSVINTSALNGLNPNDPNAQAKMSTMLQLLGAQPSDALTAVTTHPDATLNFLNQVANGTPNMAQDGFVSDFHLDPNLVTQVGQIVPPIDPTNPSWSTISPSGQESWNKLPVQCGTPGIAGNLMLNESGCGANTNNPINANVHGPLQFLCGTWTTYATVTGNSQYSDCSYANDPTISAQVTNAYYGQLVPQIQPQCQAAGVSMTSCMYTYHWLGSGGFNSVMNALPGLDQSASAASLCGSVISSPACSANPGFFTRSGQPLTISGMFNNMDNNLLGGNGQITGLYAATQGSGLSGYNANTSPPSFLGLTTGTNSNTNGFGNSNNTSLVNQLGQTQIMSMMMGPLQNLFKSFGASNQTTSQKNVTSPLPLPAPSVAIGVLPNTVSRGSAVSVSWSSNGTSLSQTCTITTQDGAMIAQGNGGSQSYMTSSSSPTTLTFTALCVGVNGQQVQQSANVTVQ